MLVEEIQQLEHDNIELKDKVDNVMSEKIVTFEGGKYTNNIRACCYELLPLNVGVKNVKAVIECPDENCTQRSRLLTEEDSCVRYDA